MIFIWSLTYLLLGAIIYCMMSRKWLLAILMALFLFSFIYIGEQYKRSITVVAYELVDEYLIITYKNLKTEKIYYKDIEDLKHYCEGRSGLSGCGVSIYTKDGRIELPSLQAGAEPAKELKAILFAKMNQSH